MRDRALPRVWATKPTATRVIRSCVKWAISATRRKLSAHDAIPDISATLLPCLRAMHAMPASLPRFAAPRAVLRVRPASTNPQLDTKPVYSASPRSILTSPDRLVATVALLGPRFGSPRRNNAPSALRANTRQHPTIARTFHRATNSTARRRWHASPEEYRRKEDCGLRAHRVRAERTPTTLAL